MRSLAAAPSGVAATPNPAQYSNQDSSCAEFGRIQYTPDPPSPRRLMASKYERGGGLRSRSVRATRGPHVARDDDRGRPRRRRCCVTSPPSLPPSSTSPPPSPPLPPPPSPPPPVPSPSPAPPSTSPSAASSLSQIQNYCCYAKRGTITLATMVRGWTITDNGSFSVDTLAAVAVALWASGQYE